MEPDGDPGRPEFQGTTPGARAPLDRDSNPSLIQLREIATVLKTTVAELVEPDFNQRVLVMLNSWVADRAAARSTISKNDRNKAVKAILRRLADSMED